MNHGSENVTFYEVSRRCGVSTATVSRVLNNSPKVRPETRQRVLAAMQQLSYQPNHAARALAGQQSHAIGVILPEIASGFYAHVLRGIDRALAVHGFHVLTTFCHDRADEKVLAQRMLGERRVDGLILMSLKGPDIRIAEIAQQGGPLVLLDRPSSVRGVGSVSIHNAQGVRLALTHLAQDCGYRSIGLLTGPAGTYDADARLAACRRYAGDCGLSFRPEFVADGAFDAGRAQDLVGRWLEGRTRRPEAIFAHNDEMAIGALNACRERGVRVPEDIGVIGFDDAESARLIGLTTVNVPLMLMGFRAGELMLAACRGETPFQRIRLNTSLVIRTTCRRRYGDRQVNPAVERKS